MNILEKIGEYLVGMLIVGSIFWVPWCYYFFTGNYLNFGGGL